MLSSQLQSADGLSRICESLLRNKLLGDRTAIRAEVSQTNHVQCSYLSTIRASASLHSKHLCPYCSFQSSSRFGPFHRELAMGGVAGQVSTVAGRQRAEADAGEQQLRAVQREMEQALRRPAVHLALGSVSGRPGGGASSAAMSFLQYENLATLSVSHAFLQYENLATLSKFFAVLQRQNCKRARKCGIRRAITFLQKFFAVVQRQNCKRARKHLSVSRNLVKSSASPSAQTATHGIFIVYLKFCATELHLHMHAEAMRTALQQRPPACAQVMVCPSTARRCDADGKTSSTMGQEFVVPAVYRDRCVTGKKLVLALLPSRFTHRRAMNSFCQGRSRR
eukprot:1171126-Pleurochrysis_carterae.AAC.1